MKCLVILFFTSFADIVYSKSLEDLIKDEFLIMKEVGYRFNASLEIEHLPQGSSRTIAGGRIIVNINQVEKLIEHVKPAYKLVVVQLVLAHEMAHQSLNETYGSMADTLLNECQADLIAGFTLYQRWGADFINKFLKSDLALNEYVNEGILVLEKSGVDALNAIFELGDDYSRKHRHPRKEQRRTAVRDGLAYGSFWLIYMINRDPRIPASGKTQSKDYERRYTLLLNHLPNDNIMTWSHRQAKKIIHFHATNSKNVLVYNRWTWDISSSNPYLTFQQLISNRNQHNITLNFYNQIYTVLRSDPENTLYWELINSKPYSISLRPNETREINGKIRWEATKDLMPSYVGLGMKGSLYSCTSLNSSPPVNYLNNSALATVYSQNNNLTTIEVLIDQRKHIPSYIEGVGLSFDVNFENIIYESSIRLPDALETNIKYHKSTNDYELVAKLYSGKNLEVAKNMYRELEKGLAQVLFDSRIVHVTDDNFHITDREKRVSGEVMLVRFQKMKEYAIFLHIFQN